MKNPIKNVLQYMRLLFRDISSHSCSISEYHPVLHNPLLLKLVAADIISTLGNIITYFALLKKVYEISGGNVVDLGFLTIAQILPFIILGPFAGVVADRISRRRVLIITDLCNGLAVVMLIFIDNLNAVCVVASIASCFYVFRAPAQKALEPNLVAKNDIPLLNSVKSFSTSFTSITGYAAGAAIVAFSGVNTSFVIDAATFFVSAAIIAGIHLDERHIGEKNGDFQLLKTVQSNHVLQELKTEITAGATIIRDNVTLKLLLVLVMMIRFLFGMQRMLFYVFIHETLQMGDKAELAWGLIMSCLGIGSIIGSIIFGLLTKSYRNRFKLFLNVLLFDGSVLAIFSMNTFFPFTVFVSFLLGIFCAAPLIILNTILQETVEDKNRGKVFSLFSILDSPMALLSIFIGTATAKLITAQGTLLLFALLEISTVVAIVFSRTYRMLNQNDKNETSCQEMETTTAIQIETDA